MSTPVIDPTPEPVVTPEPTPTPTPVPTPVAQPEQRTDWKAEARKWEDRAKENKTAAEELAAIKAANQTEAEKAAARAEAAESRAQGLLNRTVQAEIKALAADTFAYPELAAQQVNPADFITEDGEVDTAALKTALDEALAKYPLLAKTAAKPAGDVGQGAHPNDPAGKPGQLGRDDIKGMTPEAIEKARIEGRLNDLLGIKT